MSSKPVENSPVENPPVENPPVENPPVENPPVENPPVENTSTGTAARPQARPKRSSAADDVVQEVTISLPLVPDRIQSLERPSVLRTQRVQPVHARETRAVVDGDTVALSAEAQAALAQDRGDTTGSARTSDAEDERGATIYTERGRSAAARGPEGTESGDDEQPATPLAAPAELTEREQAAVEELQARDQEVRRREQAHAARGGSFASTPQYKYETGPDGRRYAVDGSVSIDVAEVDGDVKATLRKMETVVGAASAAANPSPQDRAVARAARAVALEARAQLTAQALEYEDTLGDDAPDTTGARPVEESQDYAAATAPIRSRVNPPLRDKLDAYRATGPPSD